MNKNYHIDKENRIVFLTFEGELSISQQTDLLSLIYQDQDYIKGSNFFLDYSRAWPSFDVEIDTIEKGADFLKSFEEKMGNCRFALFTPDDYSYTLANIFKKLIETSIIETEVFTDKEKAMKWLGV